MRYPKGNRPPRWLACPHSVLPGCHDAKTWFGAFAPAGTPKARIEELAAHLAAVIKSQTFHQRFIRLGGYDAVGNTPAEFRKFLAEDRLRGRELVRISGVKINE